MQTSTAISRLAAAALADNGAAKDRHPLAAPLTKRFDAILHVIEVVLRDMLNADPATRVALARLTEALARVLDLPPQPQESLRDFTRRLAAHMDTLPPAARMLIEKQMNQQSLLSALKVLVETLRPGIVIDLNLDLPGLRDRVMLGAPLPDIFDDKDRSAYHRPTIQVPLPTRMAFPQAPGVAPGAPHLQKALGQAFSPEASLPGKATMPSSIPDIDDTMPAFREAAAFLAHDGEALAHAVSIALGRSVDPALLETSVLMPQAAETAEQMPGGAFPALADEHPAGAEASPILEGATLSSEPSAGEAAETAPQPASPLEQFETLDTKTGARGGPNRTVPPDLAEAVPSGHARGQAENRPRLAPPAAAFAAAPALERLPAEAHALPQQPATRTVQAPDGVYQAETEGSWAGSPDPMGDRAVTARPSLGSVREEAIAGRAGAVPSAKKDAAGRGDVTMPGRAIETDEKRVAAAIPAVLLAAATAGLQETAASSGQIDEWETLFYMLSGSLGDAVEAHPALPARPGAHEQAARSVGTTPTSDAAATAELLVADDEEALHHRASLSARTEDSLAPVNPGRGLEAALMREALGFAFVPYLPVDTADRRSDDDDEEPRRHASGNGAGSDGNDERQGGGQREADGSAARQADAGSDDTDAEHHDAYELYQRLSDLS
jgi:hypothetical protein